MSLLLLVAAAHASSWQVGNCGRGVACPQTYTPTPVITGTPPATLTPTPSQIPSPTLTLTFSNTPTVTPTAIPGSYQQRVIVAQATAVTDSQGKVWAADQAYVPGSWGYALAGTSYQSQQDAVGTADPALYKGFRQGTNLDYKFDVPSGNFLVTLLFCDFVSQQAGQRIFSVSAQNVAKLSNVDLYSLVGNGQAYNASFSVVVSGGTLDLSFSASQGTAVINAISVQGLQSLYTPTPTPTPNLTPFVIQIDKPDNAVLLP